MSLNNLQISNSLSSFLLLIRCYIIPVLESASLDNITVRISTLVYMLSPRAKLVSENCNKTVLLNRFSNKNMCFFIISQCPVACINPCLNLFLALYLPFFILSFCMCLFFYCLGGSSPMLLTVRWSHLFSTFLFCCYFLSSV